MLGRIVDELARREGPRILAGLIGRFGGNFDLAEDALQDAYERALASWPSTGIPERPAAWLTTVAQRAAIDRLRRLNRNADNSDEVLEQIAAEEPEASTMVDCLTTACGCLHLLPSGYRGAGANGTGAATLCSLSTREIPRSRVRGDHRSTSRACEEEDRRSAYSLYRASREELPDRLSAVLTSSISFSTRATRRARRISTSTGSERRSDAACAIARLATACRARGARHTCADVVARCTSRCARWCRRALVPLEEQDRSRWDRAKIVEGLHILERAIALRRRGPYQLQAAIAALHSKASTAASTDWQQIAALYGALHQMVPTAIVELNAAAAVAMVSGPEAGLVWIERVDAGGELGDYHLLPAARADLLRRAGRGREAKEHYRRAIELARNPAERLYLERRLREVTESI
jgi:RNA polymerase sigma-70 factor (ECF subfamily)